MATFSKNEKIKLLIRLRSLELGGVQRVILGVLKNMPRDQFSLTLLVDLNQGELRTDIPEDITYKYIGKGKEDFIKFKPIYLMQLIYRRLKLYFYKKFPAFLHQNILNGEKYDLEIASSYYEFEDVLTSPNKKSRKIGWFHSDVSYDKDIARVQKRIAQMQRMDFMIFGAKQTRQIIADLYQVTYPKSVVIYNVIDQKEILEKADLFEVNYKIHPVFVSVGRLHTRKGYHTLAKIHARLIEEGLTHEINIIGGGFEMENLTAQVKSLNIASSFHLLDAKKNPYPYIKAADFFILPSQSESYPLIIGEALCLKKPILSTNVGGIPEMIEQGIDGWMVNYDEEEIYKAMKMFLTDVDLVEKLKNGAQNAPERFDESIIYNQLIDVFETQFKLK